MGYHVVYHGGPCFSQKSHAHLQSNYVLRLLELGHDVTICKPLDLEQFNISNPKHKVIKGLCRPDHIYSDYNIWTTSRETEFKEGGYKFDCFLHSDGHYKVRPEEYERFKILPFNYYLRAGLDAARTISDQFQRPTYGFYDNGLETDIFNIDVEPYNFHRKDAFIFLVVSQTLYPADIRGLNIALDAFTKTFGNRDDVYLVLKIAEYNIHLHEFSNQWKNIIYMPGLVSFSDLAKIYKGADCLLSPIKGALWESPILQAMACGTPAIATTAGGPELYIKEDTGFLIDFDWKFDEKGDINYAENYRGNIWKEPNFDNFCRAMKTVVRKDKVLEQMGRRAAADVKERFGYDVMVGKFIEFLEGSEEYVRRPNNESHTTS